VPPTDKDTGDAGQATPAPASAPPPPLCGEGLPRTLTAILGSDTTVRLVDGLRCPRCRTAIRLDPEKTDIGWRLLCAGCHVDILVVENDVP
jgi:hypothetical protein